jgi:glycosyltransferase involved in cell wall biosynthesis
MKVMIDGYNLGLEQGTGVATYARNLSFSLHALGHEVSVLYGGKQAPGVNPLLREIAFFDADAGEPPAWLVRLRAARELVSAPMGYLAIHTPITGAVIPDAFKSRMPYFDSIWNAHNLFTRSHNAFRFLRSTGRVYVSKRPDLMHWTYPLPLRVVGARNIYTFHDLVPLRLPYTTLDNKRRYLRLCQRLSRRADHIVTVSENSRKDIINLLGVHPDRVTNTYQAVTIPEKFRNKPESVVREEVEGTFGLRYGGYFLFYGAIEPKKNIGRLIEAYLGSGVEAPLVVAGKRAWKSEQELRLLYEDHIRSLITVGAETRVKRRVIQLEYAPFPLLVSLIRGAKATLFPSLYEGFGLPVLESMLLGTPVLSSNRSSVPEVAGDAAYLVDPYDTREMAQGIKELDSNEALRSELAARGRRRASLFSEAAYQQRLGDLYQRALGERGGGARLSHEITPRFSSDAVTSRTD